MKKTMILVLFIIFTPFYLVSRGLAVLFNIDKDDEMPTVHEWFAQIA